MDPDLLQEVCTVTRHFFPPVRRNRIVYLHGRSQQLWPTEGSALPWTTSVNRYEVITPSPHGPVFRINRDVTWSHPASNVWAQNIEYYDGSSDFENNSYNSARQQVKRVVKDNCTGNDVDSCVIMCYSAGCARMMLAFEDLEAEMGNSWTYGNKVAWISSVASAAGGTEVSDAASNWLPQLLAFIFGEDDEPIDRDLKVGNMRYNYAFMQNSAPAPMYHSAGAKNMCYRKWGINWVCGNNQMPGDKGDGAVPAHSACGYSQIATRTGCCQCAAGTGQCFGPTGGMRPKYTNRLFDHCPLLNKDHREMFTQGVIFGSTRIQGGIPSGGSDGTNNQSAPPPPPPPGGGGPGGGGPGGWEDCGPGTGVICP